MNSLSCKLNLPLGPSLRDPSLEADLQARLDDGHRIFVLGDIHGHLATFRALLHRLNLKPEDRVVCLGDMIDRGPNSAGLVHLLRTHPQVICLKGNHEHMAIQCVQPDGSFEAWQPWMQRGGKSTYASYIVQANGDLYEAKRQMAEDFMWLDTLPTQIVLDHLRFVHAGYDPRMPLDMQGEKELLWIRKEWFQHEGAVDPAAPSSSATRRPRNWAMRAKWPFPTTAYRTGVPPGSALMWAPTTTWRRAWPPWKPPPSVASNNPRFAATDGSNALIHEPERKGKKRAWKGEENLRESEVARSFGLKALASRAKSASTSTLRAQRELEKAGVVFPEHPDAITAGGYRVYRKAREERLQGASRGPTSFRVYRQRGQPTWARAFRSLTCSVNRTLLCRNPARIVCFPQKNTDDAPLMHGKQHLSA